MSHLFELILVALVAMLPPYFLLWIVINHKRKNKQ